MMRQPSIVSSILNKYPISFWVSVSVMGQQGQCDIFDCFITDISSTLFFYFYRTGGGWLDLMSLSCILGFDVYLFYIIKTYNRCLNTNHTTSKVFIGKSTILPIIVIYRFQEWLMMAKLLCSCSFSVKRSHGFFQDFSTFCFHVTIHYTYFCYSRFRDYLIIRSVLHTFSLDPFFPYLLTHFTTIYFPSGLPLKVQGVSGLLSFLTLIFIA